MTRSELIRIAQEKLQMDVTKYYHFAFCGGTGAGKSTLINALLNREDVDFVEGKPHSMYDSAPTGVWQTTMTINCYGYPEGHDLQNMRLWDIPGLGTNEHPSATYFNDKHLYTFDILMVVIQKELGEYEYTVLESAQKQNIPTVVVVTKAEMQVESKIRKLFNNRNPPLADYKEVVQETIDEARERVFKCLQSKGLQKTPVFVVSAWKYRELMDQMEKINPQEVICDRRVCLDQSMSEELSNQAHRALSLHDNEVPQQDFIEDERLAKNALLSFELSHLLEYIASVAVYRRS